MSDNNTTIQSISAQLWAMANELRGNMDAGEFKNYILAFMFYRYLSEHQEHYLESNKVIDIAEGQSINDAYWTEAIGEAPVSYSADTTSDDLMDYREDISKSLGYAIDPRDTWASLLHRINDKNMLPSDYQTLFDHFNANAALNSEAEQDFSGVFNDINRGDSRLGASTTARAKSLNAIVKMVDEINYIGEDGKDILGEIYEYLIGQFAASAGKKGGEFYTPHQVSQILARIVTQGADANQTGFSVYDPAMGSTPPPTTSPA